MGLYRDNTGRLIEVDDRFAEANGFVPAEPTALRGAVHEAGRQEREDQRGIADDINAVGTGFFSGATFGLSDAALANSLTEQDRAQLQADLEAHPHLRMAGEIGGAVAGGFAAPGSVLGKTPAGYLSNVAAREVETGLAQGGVGGVGRALNAMGVEGAAQNVGQYIGHSAIEDKELTAEGLAGSAGTGYAFGAAGGGAALGVVKGAMAARRLYSRVMDGGQGAKAAESAWKIASQEAIDADTATLRAAEEKLDTFRKGKIEAQRGLNEAGAAYREEKRFAASAEPRPAPEGAPAAPEGPEPLIDVAPQSGQGGQTTAYQKPEFDPAEATAFDESMPSTRDQVNDQAAVIGKADKGAKTGAYKATTQRISREAPTELEAQLKGTKAQVDEGTALKDVRPEPSNTVPGQTFPGRELDIRGKVYEMRRQGRTKEGMIADRQAALSEVRFKATEDLLGPQAAKMERELQEIVDEYNEARAGLGTLSDGIPEPLEGGEIGRAVRGEPHRGAPWGGGDGPRVTGPDEGSIPVIDVYGIEKGVKRAPRGGDTRVGSPGKRMARQILDDAHEEALLRGKYGADPAEAGKAFSEAEELENLLSQIDDTSDGVPRMVDGSPQEMFFDQMANDIRKIHRYEEASAKLSDAVGEASHPTSLQKAKLLRDAEKDSMRKVMDRTARAVDDAEQFGPTYASPKERVDYARGRLNDAQKHYDELGVQEKEARLEYDKARKKLKAGEKAHAQRVREEAKAAASATKLGAQDVGGILEMLDVPGLPKPSDLPIIGPMLGAWLKFRTLKKAMGRMMGRVPATADAQVAARAAVTRDRIARAVDRSLGLIEKTGKFAARRMPATAGILANRIYDDGGEDPGPKASIQKQAGARMREISAYVHAPGAIEMDVRRQLQGVTDPDLIAAAEQHRRFMMEYILKNLPKVPDQGLLKTHEWEPSAGQAMSLARRMEALDDPPAVFEKMAQGRDLVSIEAADTLRDVYPKLFQEALRRAVERSSEASNKIPYRTRVQMSVFYKMPFEPALSPENFQITQSVYDRKPASPAYNPAVPGAEAPPPPMVQPSVAQPTDLAQQYMTSFDRR